VTTTFPSGSGNHMITEYNILGLATKTIDLNGIATYNYFDERGRLTRATYPEIGDVYYYFDALGRKTKVTDALSKVLRYYHDAASRVTKTGAGSTADIMPTYPPAADLRRHNAATGQMTKTRHGRREQHGAGDRHAPGTPHGEGVRYVSAHHPNWLRPPGRACLSRPG
jgi:YD repeat-containing protein